MRLLQTSRREQSSTERRELQAEDERFINKENFSSRVCGHSDGGESAEEFLCTLGFLYMRRSPTGTSGGKDRAAEEEGQSVFKSVKWN